MTKHDSGKSPDPKSVTMGFVAATIVVIFWSGFNIVSRMGGRSVLTPYDLAALRFGISAVILLPFLFATRFVATPLQLATLALFTDLATRSWFMRGFRWRPPRMLAFWSMAAFPSLPRSLRGSPWAIVRERGLLSHWS